MFTDFFYREKGLFLQSLHPATALTYLGVLLVLALVFTNPLYLLGLFLVIYISIRLADGLNILKIYIKAGLVMATLIIAINSLMARAGETIIWLGPSIPVFGRLCVSLEALFFGAAMGVRMLDIMGVFCLYNLIIHPDKIISLLSRFALKSALVLSLATRMFPSMIRQIENIREVQSLRGVDFNSGTLKERLRKHLAVLNILLLTSLEDSFEIAEAMQARAFGSGRRSCYRKDVYRPRDIICLSGSLGALVLTVYGQFMGFSTFSFYPQLDDLLEGPVTLILLAGVLLCLSIPVVFSWGWQHCRYIKSKI